jgi:hypothetical protein
MKRLKIRTFTSIEKNDSLEGETIEDKIQRVVENNEPIVDGAPIIYTDRREGVLPAYNIRTDRFEVAIDGMSAVAKSNFARRDEYFKELEAKEKGTNNLEETSDNTSDLPDIQF